MHDCQTKGAEKKPSVLGFSVHYVFVHVYQTPRVYVCGIKVGGLSCLESTVVWITWWDGGEGMGGKVWPFQIYSLLQWHHEQLGGFFCEASVFMQKCYKLKLKSKHISQTGQEGLWATLSSCSRPSSHSYIVNEQEEEEEEREREKTPAQVQFLKGMVRWHNTHSKTPESPVPLTGWEYEQGSYLSIKKSIH